MGKKKITTTSKYREALNRLFGMAIRTVIDKRCKYHERCDDQNDLDTLEELIEKYEDLCQTIKDINDSNWKSKGTQFLVQYMEKINNE